LRALYDDRRDLYFYAEAEDKRLQAAARELEPLEEPDIPVDISSLCRKFVLSSAMRSVVIRDSPVNGGRAN